MSDSANPARVRTARTVAERLRGRVAGGLLLCLMATWLPAQAQWVWKDAEGRVTASDRPPPRNVPERDILSRPAPQTPPRRAVAPAPAASAPAPQAVVAGREGTLEREVQARRQAAEQQQTAQQRAEQARVATQRAENCSRARGHMAALESGQRMSRTNERGEREILDDRARADELRRAREAIAGNCG
jgi:hypothetical protein